MMSEVRTAAEIPQQQHNIDRLRRADSWRRRSEEIASDTEKFIFLWIAFNSAYGVEVELSESQKFNRFCEEIVKRDEEGILHRVLWNTFSGPVRVLLKNRYVYEPFWMFVRGSPQTTPWRTQFERDNRRAFRSLANGDTSDVLRVVLSRLYTLRNQIFHGGATYAAGWGQDQVRDGSRIMASMVPAVLDIMGAEIEKNPASDVWGRVSYPRLEYDRDQDGKAAARA